jgi:hypothetical protein
MKGEAVKAIQKIPSHNAGTACPQASGMAPFWLRDRNHLRVCPGNWDFSSEACRIGTALLMGGRVT